MEFAVNRRVIEVVEYDPEWASQFESERVLLLDTLGKIAVGIFHIGSTSVKGLVAKPIIDILIEVSSLEALDSKAYQMESLNYLVKGENGLAGRRYFQKGGIQRSHHIHAYKSGDLSLERHIAFRDYLRLNQAVSIEYAKVKVNAANNCDNDSNKYMQSKNRFIQHYEKLALEWFSTKKV